MYNHKGAVEEIIKAGTTELTGAEIIELLELPADTDAMKLGYHVSRMKSVARNNGYNISYNKESKTYDFSKEEATKDLKKKEVKEEPEKYEIKTSEKPIDLMVDIIKKVEQDPRQLGKLNKVLNQIGYKAIIKVELVEVDA